MLCTIARNLGPTPEALLHPHPNLQLQSIHPVIHHEGSYESLNQSSKEKTWPLGVVVLRNKCSAGTLNCWYFELNADLQEKYPSGRKPKLDSEGISVIMCSLRHTDSVQGVHWVVNLKVLFQFGV